MSWALIQLVADLHVVRDNFFRVISYIYVGSQIVAHTQMEIGDGPNKPNTINL